MELKKLTDNDLMPFGKHKGVKLANLPADYLFYMYDADELFGAIKEYVEDNYEALEKEISEQNDDKERRKDERR